MQLNQFSSAFKALPNIDSLSVGSLVSDFARYYPDIDHWFSSVVIPGIVNGTRRIIVKHDDGAIRGLSILKRDEDERKICTFWVHPSSRGAGVGQNLLEESVEWLGSAAPLLTVPEEALESFLPLLARNRFELCHRAYGYYRAGRCEYVFNGSLVKKLSQSVLQ
ncbi:GNAT family N-acetyltransferase [Rhizobium sp. CFBP 8762]|uniref:GNAT family N-acetyltransferase n=1 Tax=Rhizobium sp. CFBP 8762 TaxID=2775279 RepID=UPI00177ED729|nr:GNAT family N-acetyltransferase [Rhizobium sp. CFBP 8762]MBD8556846.1 GNAT family N-acetyltransferase [Rhizobium sp. CFBP 8762]